MLDFQRSIVCVVLVLISKICYGQSVITYKGYDGKYLTKAQVDSLVAQTARRIKPQGRGAYLQTKEKLVKQDSLIYSFTIVSAPIAMVEAHYRQQQYIGKPLPSFVLKDINGNPISTKSLIGKPVLLNLWFTTCRGCIEEMPALNALTLRKENKSIQFIAVTYESNTEVRKFLSKYSFVFKQIVDADAFCSAFTDAYPLSIFVDRAGTIRSIQGPLPFLSDSALSSHKVLSPDGKTYLDTTALDAAIQDILK